MVCPWNYFSIFGPPRNNYVDYRHAIEAISNLAMAKISQLGHLPDLGRTVCTPPPLSIRPTRILCRMICGLCHKRHDMSEDRGTNRETARLHEYAVAF